MKYNKPYDIDEIGAMLDRIERKLDVILQSNDIYSTDDVYWGCPHLLICKTVGKCSRFCGTSMKRLKDVSQ